MGRNFWRQPPTRMTRKPHRYWQCRRKAAAFGAPDAAVVEARAARRRYGRPFQIYECEHCGRWHIGASRRLQRWVEDQHRKRPDVVLLAMLGERTYFCGELESTGPVRPRLARIGERARRAA
jgi:hypothetical protein